MLRTVAVCATVILMAMKFLNIDPVPTWPQVFIPIGLYILLVIAIMLIAVLPVAIQAFIAERKLKKAKKKLQKAKENKSSK